MGNFKQYTRTNIAEMHDTVFAKTLKRLSDAGVIDLRVNV